MYLTKLRAHTFRNYQHLELNFERDGAFIFGTNGTGKSNLLESIFLLSTGRSQRNASKRDMINSEKKEAFVEGRFVSPASGRVDISAIGFSRDGTAAIRINGEKLRSYSEWFHKSAVVSFGPNDILLVHGSPFERRRFVDMLLSQISSSYLEHLILYRKNILERNKILSCGKIDTIALDTYDERLSEFGSTLIIHRLELFAKIAPMLSSYYRAVSLNRDEGKIVYKPSFSGDFGSKKEWKNVFYNTLKEKRRQDISLGFSSVGPHRDDFRCLVNNRSARSCGSQGQCRSLALALRLCSMACLEEKKKDSMIILVDDAFSELDTDRSSRVYPLIRNKGQVFLTSISKSVPYTHNLPTYEVGNNTVVCL